MQYKIICRRFVFISVITWCAIVVSFQFFLKNGSTLYALNNKDVFTLQKSLTKMPRQQAGVLFNEVGLPTDDIYYGLPVRLVIPKINSNSTIESVGITKQGEMGLPSDIKNTAWFNLGVKPGEIGSAVIGGHYGWKNGKKSAFDNLHFMKVGDVVYIKEINGNTITFIVKKIVIYPWNASSKIVFNSSDGKSHLNLITCYGLWDKDKKKYSERLVVFTDKITK